MPIQQKIERLFREAQNDMSKVLELKNELDRWKVYEEYESALRCHCWAARVREEMVLKVILRLHVKRH